MRKQKKIIEKGDISALFLGVIIENINQKEPDEEYRLLHFLHFYENQPMCRFYSVSFQHFLAFLRPPLPHCRCLLQDHQLGHQRQALEVLHPRQPMKQCRLHQNHQHGLNLLRWRQTARKILKKNGSAAAICLQYSSRLPSPAAIAPAGGPPL